MKVTTSVTLSQEVLDTIGAAGSGSLSDFIERAAWDTIRRLQRQERNARDAAIHVEHADDINRETLETLEYQVDLDELFESLEQLGNEGIAR